MATARSSPARLAGTDSAEAVNYLKLDVKESPADPNMLKDLDVVNVGPLRDDTSQLGSLGSVRDHQTAYYTQAQSVYNGGYGNASGKPGTFLAFANAGGLENGSYGVYNKTPSHAFHAYDYTPQMPHRTHGLVPTQLPSVRGHGELGDIQQLSSSDSPYYQPHVIPNIPYIASSVPASQVKWPLNIGMQVDSRGYGSRIDYFPSLGSSAIGTNFSGSCGGSSFLEQNLERFGAGGLWSDRPKPLNGRSSLAHLVLPAASPNPIGSQGLSRNNFTMALQQKESFQRLGSCSSFNFKGYPHCLSDQGSGYGIMSSSGLGTNAQNWSTLDEAKQGGRCSDISCSCAISLDTLSERNRGPRAFKPRGHTTSNGSSVDNCREGTHTEVINKSYNQPDFITNYKDATFFVIKSYSEDNVHKSIKYGVWASTPSGHKKLDEAYHEAKEKGACPIFLLFSVNASAQFCGVAEMVGPVDFDKSVDYWQQDKWSGQFPVKWHIIKDVPNSQFRHIILENNDKKPVTNSRDTQEVELEQGVEMLSIFKNYETYSSILDDFQFYEERQKAMEERKSRQQTSNVAASVVGASEQQIPMSLPSDFLKKMSKSFAEAVLLNDNNKKNSSIGKVLSFTSASGSHGS